MKLAQLWQWQGQLGRLAYFLWGFLLLALKYNLDRLIAFVGFEIPWYPFSYFVPPASDVPFFMFSHSPHFPLFLSLLALALPFIALGIGLTLQRLRSAALPLSLVLFFFVPMINLLFFALLCLWPEREARPSAPQAESRWSKWLPKTALGSALAGVLITSLLGLVLTAIAVMGLGEYGFGLFVGLPFLMGLVTTVLFGLPERRSLKASLGVSMVALGFFALGLVALAIEGLICLVMAAPLGIPLVALGAVAGWLIQSRQRPLPGPTLTLMLLLPAVMGFERALDLPAPLFAVTTEIEIDAPPETVWQHVISFSELPPPADWVLRTGIAYPLRAEIRGEGVGAVRHCVFSTGPFVEPIEVWDPPHQLKFAVTEQPPSMQELSPYAIHPPHLDNFLRSQGGQFLLTPLPNGQTRLAGTTWYEHQIWPAQYWRIWSDFIIHRIHWRVLEHIQQLSEAEARVKAL